MSRAIPAAFLFAALVLAGCVPTSRALPEGVVETDVPRGATAVVVESSRTSGDLYRALYQHLASQGYPVVQESAEGGTLATGPVEREMATAVAIRLFVEDAPSGSRATLWAKWGVAGDALEDMYDAEWKPNNRAGVAFGHAIRAAESVGGEVSYRTP